MGTLLRFPLKSLPSFAAGKLGTQARPEQEGASFFLFVNNKKKNRIEWNGVPKKKLMTERHLSPVFTEFLIEPANAAISRRAIKNSVNNQGVNISGQANDHRTEIPLVKLDAIPRWSHPSSNRVPCVFTEFRSWKNSVKESKAGARRGFFFLTNHFFGGQRRERNGTSISDSS